MSSEMRECPFCGNQPRSGWQGTGVPGMDDCGYWGIDCCNAFAHADTEAEALAQWNRRSDAPNGSWLWCKLMDFCQKRRFPPAEFNDLFAIVTEAHELNNRALLARTEAGAPHHPLAICPTCKDYYEVCECTPDAAPVADVAVAWRVEWDEDNDGDAFYVTLDTERGAMGRANEAIAEGFKGVRIRRLVYGDTHPQDASGDAELLDWLVENEFDLVTRREDMGEDEYAIWWFVIDSRKSSPWRLHTVSGHPLGSPREAIIAAMQAKEAK